LTFTCLQRLFALHIGRQRVVGELGLRCFLLRQLLETPGLPLQGDGGRKRRGHDLNGLGNVFGNSREGGKKHAGGRTSGKGVHNRTHCIRLSGLPSIRPLPRNSPQASPVDANPERP
jgi:hypothetical protein